MFIHRDGYPHETTVGAIARLVLRAVGCSRRRLVADAGDRRRLRELTGNGADVDRRWEETGETALHAAARERHTPAVEMLLGMGADVSLASRDGWTALHLAVASHLADSITLIVPAPGAGGDPRSPVPRRARRAHGPTSPQHQVAATLLARGADVNARDGRGWTPLHHAATVYAPDHSVALVWLLLAHGADPMMRTCDGRTALEHAAATGLSDVLELLSSATTRRFTRDASC